MKTTNLSASSEKLSISVLLENKIKNDETIFGAGIRYGLKKGDINRVFEMIKEQYPDNPTLVKSIIGEELTNRIINF